MKSTCGQNMKNNQMITGITQFKICAKIESGDCLNGFEVQRTGAAEFLSIALRKQTLISTPTRWCQGIQINHNIKK